MKKLKFILSGLLIITGICVYFIIGTSSSKAEHCAKCTGSASCRACKTCNYCAHCNSGGSCGVCSYSSAPTPAPTYSKPKEAVPNSGSDNSSKSNKNEVSAIYKVKTQTLNVRSSPSTDASILFTLKYGYTVTVLETVNDKWVKINWGAVTGYVYKQFLEKK